MVHCALCISDKSGSYFIYLHTLVVSILSNATKPLHFHIIADETIRAEQRRTLEDLAGARGGRVVFYPPPSIPADVAAKIPPRFGVGSMYRLFLHEIVPCDKLIYLDCDIVVNMDLAELYAIDIESRHMAAVEEPNLTRKDIAQGLQSFPKIPDKYFNSGVLLMNIKKIRELCKDTNILLSTFVEKYDTLAYKDQDVLNGLMAAMDDGVLFIDEKYNYIINTTGRMLESLSELRGKILHYTWTKPLDFFYPATLPFWKYHPWAGSVEELFEKLEGIPPRKELLTCQTALYTRKRTAKFRRYYDLLAYGLLGFIKRRLFPKKYKDLAPKKNF